MGLMGIYELLGDSEGLSSQGILVNLGGMWELPTGIT